MALKGLHSSGWLAAALLSSLIACAQDGANEAGTHAVESALQPEVMGAVIKLGGAAQIETVAAARGAMALDVTPLGSALTAPGVVTTTRAGLIEVLEQEADGLEQSWFFDEAPGTSGDLVITVGITGLAYVGSSAAGLEFRGADGATVRYGHGVWQDARGTSAAVPARYDHGKIVLIVPAGVVAGSAFPAGLDPQITVTPIP